MREPSEVILLEVKLICDLCEILLYYNLTSIFKIFLLLNILFHFKMEQKEQKISKIEEFKVEFAGMRSVAAGLFPLMGKAPVRELNIREEYLMHVACHKEPFVNFTSGEVFGELLNFYPMVEFYTVGPKLKDFNIHTFVRIDHDQYVWHTENELFKPVQTLSQILELITISNINSISASLENDKIQLASTLQDKTKVALNEKPPKLKS